MLAAYEQTRDTFHIFVWRCPPSRCQMWNNTVNGQPLLTQTAYSCVSTQTLMSIRINTRLTYSATQRRNFIDFICDCRDADDHFERAQTYPNFPVPTNPNTLVQRSEFIQEWDSSPSTKVNAFLEIPPTFVLLELKKGVSITFVIDKIFLFTGYPARYFVPDSFRLSPGAL